MSLGRSNLGERCGRGMRGEKNVLRFWWKISRERDHSEDRDIDGMGSEWILGRLGGGGVHSVGSG
jgi:hypothetical protein